MKKKKILVTGGAGFIGFHLSEKLAEEGHYIVTIDNINNYYEQNLKFDRLECLGIDRKDSSVFNKSVISDKYDERLIFVRLNLEDKDSLNRLFNQHKFDVVCNLAAQAGVRYSLTNPEAYVDSNINGFLNILECCRHNNVPRLVYASSSSVYGMSKKIPFNEDLKLDEPVSLYAASKKSNELMAYTYSHLFKIETIGLRFFTVYGPWGRPDMALFLFTNAMLNNQPISVFNNGLLSRDFTYIDDIVEGVSNTILKNSVNKNLSKIYNIGNSKPVKLLDFILEIENALSIKAEKNMLPMQLGDVYETYADTSRLKNDYDYEPSTDIKIGISEFINWFRKYYNK